MKWMTVILRREERTTKDKKEPWSLRQTPTALKFSGEGCYKQEWDSEELFQK